MDSVERPSIAVVIPAYRVRAQLAAVIAAVPEIVDEIVVVDDACPEGSGEVAESLGNPRVTVLRQEKNGGVGAATLVGFRYAARAGYDLLVKCDGDGQMNPADMVHLLDPLLKEQASCAKGNRFWHTAALKKMPVMRRLGNTGLSFVVKLAAGHWQIFDPTNGYIALRSDVFELLDERSLAPRYFFEISLLIELGKRGFSVIDVPLPARYGEESSSLSLFRSLFGFPVRLLRGAISRLWCRHIWFDFTTVGWLGLVALPLIGWSLGFGGWAWVHSYLGGVPASAGTVMFAALPFLAGSIMLLQALALETSGVFTRRVGVRALSLHPALRPAQEPRRRLPAGARHQKTAVE